MPRTVAVLGAMPNELAPLVKLLGLHPEPWGKDTLYRGRTDEAVVVASTTGVGLSRAERQTQRLLEEADVELMVMMGIAGGLDPTLVIGDLVVPEVVLDARSGSSYRPSPVPGHDNRGILHSSDTLMTDPAQQSELRAAGVCALDMETAALGAVCQAVGVPWCAFRAISDTVTDGLVDESVLALTNPDGSPKLAAVGRHLLAHPGSMKKLAKLGRDTAVATKVAARAAAQTCGLAPNT